MFQSAIQKPDNTNIDWKTDILKSLRLFKDFDYSKEFMNDFVDNLPEKYNDEVIEEFNKIELPITILIIDNNTPKLLEES